MFPRIGRVYICFESVSVKAVIARQIFQPGLVRNCYHVSVSWHEIKVFNPQA